MKLLRAVVSGLVGAVIVYAIVAIAGRAAGREADLCLLLGASITGQAGAWTWVVGAIGQLVTGAVAAVIYAAIFEWVTQRAGAVIGLIIGLAHVVFAGIATGFLPAQRLLDATLRPPGAFLDYRGLVVLVAFVIAHVLFGVLVGTLYGPVRHVIRGRVLWSDVTAP